MQREMLEDLGERNVHKRVNEMIVREKERRRNKVKNVVLALSK